MWWACNNPNEKPQHNQSYLDFIRRNYSAHRSSSNTIIKDDWLDRFREIDDRLNVYKDLFSLHDTGEHPLDKKTILIDIMLDKTQNELENRSRKYYIPGQILLVMSIITIILFVLYLTFGDVATCMITSNIYMHDARAMSIFDVIRNYYTGIDYVFFSSCYKPNISNWFEFVLILVKRIVIGGAILAISYIFFSLANACFRESTRLLHRRHSVRFIRLLLYSSNGILDDKSTKDAFGIDDVTTSGFDNIKTDAILNNLIGKLIDRLGISKGREPDGK